MNFKTRSNSVFRKLKGLTLIELMAAIVIGMVTVLVIFQTFEGVERTRRTVTSVGDMQAGGLYAVFLTGVEAGKAGTAVSANNDVLANDCVRLLGGLRDGFYPMPVLAHRGNAAPPGLPEFGAADRDPNSDQLYVFYANPRLLVRPVELTGIVGGNISVLAPLNNAFQAGDRVVISDGTACDTGIVSADGTLDTATGITTFSLDGALGIPFANAAITRVTNLGPDSDIVRQIYWLGSDRVFRRTVLDPAGVINRVEPVFSNIERFRVQYGIAPVTMPPSKFINQWVAPNPADINWSAANLFTANFHDGVHRVKAIRISFVIRGDEPEKELAGLGGFSGQIFADCGGLGAGNCPAVENITIPEDPDLSGLMDWRYRIFETVVPLRNNIWAN
ncbi:MAG: PilW family protein [Burkholderiales bacterium]|jgi:type IV pilus assembly protein PilW|nr:PilW family protein [Burkholderiales bacterium]